MRVYTLVGHKAAPYKKVFNKGKYFLGVLVSLVLLVPFLNSALTSAAPTFTEYPLSNFTPHTITSNPNGLLYFQGYSSAFPSGNSIKSINPSTGVVAAVSSGDLGPLNDGIVTGPDNNLWFTRSPGRFGNDTYVGKLVIGQSTPTLYSLGAYELPQQITVGPDGALWFTYQQYNSSYNFIGGGIGRITTSGVVTNYPIAQAYYNPNGGITAGPDGNLWFGYQVTDVNGNNLGHGMGNITTSGSITEYPVTTHNPGYGIVDLTTGPDGALWAASGDSAVKMTTSGSYTVYVATGNTGFISSITSGSDGALWVTTQNQHIGRFTTAGAFSLYNTPSNSAATIDIISGPNGNLWYTDEGTTGKIGKISGLVPTPITAINAGDGTAGSYSADTGFSGGSTYSTSATVNTSGVQTPAPQAVYQSVRYGNSFSYTFSGLNSGAVYTLRLHFNELYYGTPGGGGGDGSRVFNVAVNGTNALSNFDIFSTAGSANKAVVKQVPTTASSNGTITINFTSVTDNAMVSGIELYTGTLSPEPTTPTPTGTSALINAGGSTAGSFVSDTDFSGGTAYSSSESVDTSGVTNPAPQAVYQSVRYGNFTYNVPGLKPNTNFLVKLHFNETYWGTSNVGGGTGSRVFNVAVNGNQVLSNFDIFQTAGGANKAVTEEFNATSDVDGNISIGFSTVADNAAVSGIEIHSVSP